jgi:RNA polymerase sigma factor (sigma-70 family)
MRGDQRNFQHLCKKKLDWPALLGCTMSWKSVRPRERGFPIVVSAPAQAITEHVQALFGVGTCAGLTDGELLERFLASRHDAGEMAFESLVTRHGPMVMRVCRNMLDDPQDIHDAFQAVFLVLARRGGAIRHRDSVAAWLYGVALRVAARANVGAVRRHVRDRRTILAAQIVATDISIRHAAPPSERNDEFAVVHQEVNRLPERFRAPIVLCYLEGLTHDEAAARLRWPVGTVRSRLARAREKLRMRLTRRRVTAPVAIGPLATWMSTDDAATASVATGSAVHVTVIPRELIISVARAASRVTAGQAIAGASVSATSLVLFQGVLRTMILKKLTLAAFVLVPIGVLATVGGPFLARRSQAQDQNRPVADSTQNRSPNGTNKRVKPADIDPLIQQLLAAARNRVEAQKAYYEEGRITLDRFVDACQQLESAELLAANTDAERNAAKKRFLDLLKEIENREQAELVVGRGTKADVAEIVARRIQTEVALKRSEQESIEIDRILRRLRALERKVEQLQRAVARK